MRTYATSYLCFLNVYSGRALDQNKFVASLVTNHLASCVLHALLANNTPEEVRALGTKGWLGEENLIEIMSSDTVYFLNSFHSFQRATFLILLQRNFNFELSSLPEEIKVGLA